MTHESSFSVTDIRVRTANPAMLDRTIQQLPMCAAVVMNGSYVDGVCTVRVFDGLDFLVYAIKNQGYGELVET